jgi:hypothetical protein
MTITTGKRRPGPGGRCIRATLSATRDEAAVASSQTSVHRWSSYYQPGSGRKVMRHVCTGRPFVERLVPRVLEAGRTPTWIDDRTAGNRSGMALGS